MRFAPQIRAGLPPTKRKMQLFAFGFWLQFPKVSFAPTGTIGWDNLNLTAKGLPQLLGGEIIQKAVFFVPEHHFGNTKNIAAQIALALLDDIRSRHKARNADSAAKIIVLDGVYGNGDLRVFGMGGFCHFADKRRGKGSGHNINAARFHIAAWELQFIPEGIMIHPPHANAVFQLVIVVIEFSRGNFPPASRYHSSLG